MEEKLLRELLVKVFEFLKANHQDVLQLGVEIAALRDALDEASRQRFLALLEKHREESAARSAALESALLRAYDEIIRRVRAGEVP
jgi:hypothetical protein